MQLHLCFRQLKKNCEGIMSQLQMAALDPIRSGYILLSIGYSILYINICKSIHCIEKVYFIE